VDDPTWALCEEVLHKALARNGVAGPGDALCAVLWLLRDQHLAAARAFAARAFREGFELPDPSAATVAEAFRDVAANMAGLRGGENDPGAASGTGPAAPGMQVVADVLGELIALWDFEAADAGPGPRPQVTHPPYTRPAPHASG
jgi:hypothetical protein